MYHENDPGLLQRALDAFWDWVGELFDAASGRHPRRRARPRRRRPGRRRPWSAPCGGASAPRAARPTSAAALFDDRPRSAAEHRAAAEAHAAQGHWNQAVQERMRAVVRSLEERALLDPRPGRTADEAAAEAGRTLPAHTDRLRAAARDFDDVTYGGRTADPADVPPPRANSTATWSAPSRPSRTAPAARSTAHNARQGAAE